VRAAVSRRDGLAGAGGGKKDRFGSGRGGPGGGRRDRDGRDDSYDPQAVKAVSKAVENKPLAGLKSLLKSEAPAGD
jgi:hypothetical protein